MHKRQNVYNLFTLDQTSSKLFTLKIRDVPLPNVNHLLIFSFKKFVYNRYGCLVKMRRPTSKCEITLPFLDNIYFGMELGAERDKLLLSALFI